MRRLAVLLSLSLLPLCPLPAQHSAPAHSELEVLVTTDPNGARLEDAEVEVERLERWPYARLRTSPLKCRTENGRCRFPLAPGIYRVSVFKAGFFDALDPLSARYSEQITIQPAGPLQLEVPLIPAGSVSGRVFTEDGRPVASAFLRIRLWGGDAAHPPLQRWTHTEDDGSFLLDNLPPGRYGLFLAPPEAVRFRGLKRSEITGEFTGYSIQMFHPGMEEASWVTPVEIAPGLHLEHRTVVLRRFKVYSVTGALLDPLTREPLLEATVSLQTADEFGSELFAPRPVRTDGSFEFHSLGPGMYHLLVLRRGTHIPWVVPFVISPTSQPDLLLTVPEWQPIAVEISERRRLRDASSTRLVLEPVRGAGALDLRVNAPGVVLMGHVPPGRYRFHLESEAGVHAARALQNDVDVLLHDVVVNEAGAGAVKVWLSDEMGEIQGTLIDDEGEPLGRGWVLLVPADPERRARGDLNRQLRVGADGNFALPQIPPGDYLLLGFPVRPLTGFRAPAFWHEYGRYALKLPIRSGDRLPVGLPVAPRH